MTVSGALSNWNKGRLYIVGYSRLLGDRGVFLEGNAIDGFKVVPL